MPHLALTAEPEEVMDVLREYHAALGKIIYRFEGTLERFLGDGLMVLLTIQFRVLTRLRAGITQPIPVHDVRGLRNRDSD